MDVVLFFFPEAPGAFNGRPDPSIRHPGGVAGLKTWLFEGPKSIGSVWVASPFLLGAEGEPAGKPSI